jgi:uncharacterized phage protein (TIGR01671 family)
VYGFYTKLALSKVEKIRYQLEDYSWVDVEVIPETVGQLTGLLDRNGKEIYEGDIVRWDDCSNGKYWRFSVVEINPDIRFNCQPISAINGVKNSADCVFNYGNFIYKRTQDFLEIIGNIHDNPELLTAKQKTQPWS